MKLQHVTTVSVFTKSKLPVSDYVVNSYIGCPHKCRYCYADFMKRFSKHTEPWGDFLDIKEATKPEQLKKYEGKELMFSSVTDPYHPYEKVYQKTRQVLQSLSDAGVQPNITISTKSDLVLRDIDLFKQFNHIVVACSINTLDEDFRKDMDRGATIEKRLHALKVLHEHQIQTALFISPIFPGISNVQEIIEASSSYVDCYWLENLNLRGAYKRDILSYIDANYPELTPLYHDLYIRKNRSYWEHLSEEIDAYATQHGISIINYFYHEEIRKP